MTFSHPQERFTHPEELCVSTMYLELVPLIQDSLALCPVNTSL